MTQSYAPRKCRPRRTYDDQTAFEASCREASKGSPIKRMISQRPGKTRAPWNHSSDRIPAFRRAFDQALTAFPNSRPYDRQNCSDLRQQTRAAALIWINALHLASPTIADE